MFLGRLVGRVVQYGPVRNEEATVFLRRIRINAHVVRVPFSSVPPCLHVSLALFLEVLKGSIVDVESLRNGSHLRSVVPAQGQLPVNNEGFVEASIV